MKADDLYNQSMSKQWKFSGNKSYTEGLSNRVYHLLARNNFIINGNMIDGHIDKVKLFNAVADGSIWDIRNMGKVSVKEICQWLVDNLPNT